MKKSFFLFAIMAFLFCANVKAATVSPTYEFSDSYKNSVYYSKLMAVNLTGNQQTDIVNVALSQYGYTEGNYSGDFGGSSGGSSNYTEYQRMPGVTSGQGNASAGWCAAFVSWCARQAGIPTSVLGNSTTSSVSNFGLSKTTDARVGSLAFVQFDSDVNIDHTALVYDVDDTYVYTIEGNRNNAVEKKKYYKSSGKQVNYASTYIEFYGNPTYANSTPTDTEAPNNPIVNVDACFGGDGTIRLYGWAFDKDDYSLPVTLHVYVGGDASNGRGYHVIANNYRPDLNNIYGCGDYHGFDSTLNVPLAGNAVDVYVYGINSVGSGSNYLVGKYTVEITDSVSPTISDVKINYIDSTKYTVSCKVSDYVGVDRVMFPTWTSNNGQDDIVWYYADIIDGVASKTISIDNHNNEYGEYNTHIYAYDTSGNQNWSAFDKINMFKDETAPIISDARIISIDSSGYTLQCNITDDMMVEKVQFPTWTDENGQDDIIWYETIPVSNTITYHIKISNHNNETGYYRTHIYAYDTSGNVSISYLIWILPSDSFRVSFDSNGGSAINEIKTIKFGEAYGDLPVPERKGYTFKGWYTSTEGGTLILPSSLFNMTYHHTLYAQWEPCSYLENSAVSDPYINNNEECVTVMIISDLIDDISIFDTLYMTDGTDVREATLSDIITTKVTGPVEVGFLIRNIPFANIDVFQAKLGNSSSLGVN